MMKTENGKRHIISNGKYLPVAYTNKLLVLERDLLIKAMTRTNGNIRESTQLVFGENKTYRAFVLKLTLHNIDKRQYKTR